MWLYRAENRGFLRQFYRFSFHFPLCLPLFLHLFLLTEDASLTLNWVFLRLKTDRMYCLECVLAYSEQKTEVFCVNSIVFHVISYYVLSFIFAARLVKVAGDPKVALGPHFTF